MAIETFQFSFDFSARVSFDSCFLQIGLYKTELYDTLISSEPDHLSQTLLKRLEVSASFPDYFEQRKTCIEK